MAGFTKSKIVAEYLNKLPKRMSRSAMARVIYRENKIVFDSPEHVRKIILYVVGQRGDKQRKMNPDKSNYQPARTPSIYEFLPKSECDSYEPYQIKQSKILLISDIHIPFHDVNAVKIALEYGKQKGVNCILIGGDLLDFTSISRHDKDWRQRSVIHEINQAREFLKGLRKMFPNVKIVFKEGNHDERYELFLFRKAPELYGDDEYLLENKLRLAELKIDIVKDRRPVKIGKLTFLHGHELTGGSGGVNPARATFLKTLSSCVVGHYHKRSSHTEKTMDGNIVSVESIGCLAGLTPYYCRINKWQHGFAYIEHDVKTGEYCLENKLIVDNKVY